MYDNVVNTTNMFCTADMTWLVVKISCNMQKNVVFLFYNNSVL